MRSKRTAESSFYPLKRGIYEPCQSLPEGVVPTFYVICFTAILAHRKATARLDQLIRVAAKVQNPYVKEMGNFLAEHRVGLLVFYTCLSA
ncbi:MAG: hypothetical protein V3S14_02505, partial [Anaerolineae bacterium]